LYPGKTGFVKDLFQGEQKNYFSVRNALAVATIQEKYRFSQNKILRFLRQKRIGCSNHSRKISFFAE
jgi:hypothetical protein